MSRHTEPYRLAAFALAAFLLPACSTLSEPVPAASPTSQAVRSDGPGAGPGRNQAADPLLLGGDGIVTLRYWKIEKGKFPEFLAASQQGVWPYFEKIGARVLGMWQVMPAPDEEANSSNYDEVYLATRYASTAHWAATRDAAKLGGDGPDYETLRTALAVRRALTIETRLTFLSGATGPMGPYFLPGMTEAAQANE